MARKRWRPLQRSSSGRTYAYDPRGPFETPPSAAPQDEVTDNGPFSLTYDFANHPTRVKNAANQTIADYVYDGNLQRVKEVRGGKDIYTDYGDIGLR